MQSLRSRAAGRAAHRRERYYAWVKNENLTFAESLPGAVALVVGSIVLAYLCLKLYDEPVRRFLTKRLLPQSKR